jgi:hypothetical protein
MSSKIFLLAFYFFFVKFACLEHEPYFCNGLLNIQNMFLNSRRSIKRPRETCIDTEREFFMKVMLCAMIIFVIPLAGFASSIEEHILVHYNLIVDRLNEQGFKGPFAYEAAKFALVRQIIEDGPDRHNSISIVGMSIGGANAEALRDIGLTMGCVNAAGMSLRQCMSSEGQTFYSIHGPRANVWSAAAITILWNKYVNGVLGGAFTSEEIEGWNACKSISGKIASNTATSEEIQLYQASLAAVGKRVLLKANSMYSSTAAHIIAKIVQDMELVFEFAKSM